VIYYGLIDGFVIALIFVVVLAVIRHWAKDKLERWGYNLTRDTNRQLRETELKLDSILRGQERLERTLNAQNSAITNLRSSLSQQKTA
jgi:hypothetical protein